MSSSIERVETFIQRLHDMDYIIAAEARKIKYIFPTYIETKTLTDCLADAIYEYQEYGEDEQLRSRYAKNCLVWINKSFTCGVIKEGKGLVSKNKALERDNKRFRERLDECNKRCERLEKQIERIHNLFPDTRTFTGDVLDE